MAVPSADAGDLHQKLAISAALFMDAFEAPRHRHALDPHTPMKMSVDKAVDHLVTVRLMRCCGHGRRRQLLTALFTPLFWLPAGFRL
jgi:hypothetical protein